VYHPRSLLHFYQLSLQILQRQQLGERDTLSAQWTFRLFMNSASA
jgi:hypothetical protein